MSINSNCRGCGRLLRVADEHLGKRARCPSCGTVYEVQRGAPNLRPDETPAGDMAAVDRWHLQTPDGRTFGPVDRQNLDSWMRQGRVTADCRLRRGETGPWQDADRFYPSLGRQPVAYGAATSTAASGNPFASNPAMTGQAAGATARFVGARRYYTHPDRGAMILIFAVLGWMACPIFSFAAWIMGNSDLAEIRAGTRDPAGLDLTRAGRIVGMIHGLLILGSLLLFVMFFLMIAVLSQL